MRIRLVLASVALLATPFSGCYVVPVRAPDGTVLYDYYPMPPPGSPMPAAPGVAPAAGPAGAMPAVLSARLYPVNELATQTGVITGAVTNLMTGKGRFTVNYQG